MKKSSILVILSVLAVGSYAAAVTCTGAPADTDTGCYQCDSSAPNMCSACKSGYYFNGMANN